MPLFEPHNQPEVNCFRLTGVSGSPIMTVDNAALSTIYLTPYTGNRISLYNGASWDVMYSGQVSLAVTGRTADLPFDLYAFNLNGVLTLETLNWTSATARATALVLQDGVWVRSGSITHRYVGTCRPRSATSYSWVTTGIDTPAKLDLWNAANRVGTGWTVEASTNTWTYTLQTFRQAQGSANYQLDIVAGLQECLLVGQLVVSSSTNAGGAVERESGLGFDSTTVVIGVSGAVSAGSNSISASTAQCSVLVPIGRHFLAWLETSAATNTTTWYGDNGAVRLQSGMSGVWDC
jgi:hypothetical protein